MQTTIEGGSAFAYINVDLDPGETIIAEADAMSSMAADLDMDAKFNGGFFSGLAKAFLGGESLFVNHFTNNTNAARRVTLVQGTPGNTRAVQLNGQEYCLQPGAYIASTPGVTPGPRTPCCSASASACAIASSIRLGSSSAASGIGLATNTPPGWPRSRFAATRAATSCPLRTDIVTGDPESRV